MTRKYYDIVVKNIKNYKYENKLSLLGWARNTSGFAEQATKVRAEQLRLGNQFKGDLRNFATMTYSYISEENFQMLYDYAYREHHGSGYFDILYGFDNLLILMHKMKFIAKIIYAEK